MRVASSTEYKPKTASKASSRAITLRAADLLENRTTLQSADNESDVTRAKTRVPGNQSQTATRRARAFQVVLCEAHHATGLKPPSSTLAKLPLHATVAMQLPSGPHDAVTGKTLTSGPRTSEKRACEHQSANRKRRQWTSSNGNQANAAQTMSTKGRSVGTTPATKESLPQNDRRSFFCATVADSNRGESQDGDGQQRDSGGA